MMSIQVRRPTLAFGPSVYIHLPSGHSQFCVEGSHTMPPPLSSLPPPMTFGLSASASPLPPPPPFLAFSISLPMMYSVSTASYSFLQPPFFSSMSLQSCRVSMYCYSSAKLEYPAAASISS